MRDGMRDACNVAAALARAALHTCAHTHTCLRADKRQLSSTAAGVVVTATPTASPGLPVPTATATVLDGFGNVLAHQSFVARAQLVRPVGVPASDPVPGRLVGQLVAVSSDGACPRGRTLTTRPSHCTNVPAHRAWHCIAGVASYDELTLAGEPGSQTVVQLKAELGGFPKFPQLDLGVQPVITGSAVVTFTACPRGYILASTKQCIACRPGTVPDVPHSRVHAAKCATDVACLWPWPLQGSTRGT